MIYSSYTDRLHNIVERSRAKRNLSDNTRLYSEAENSLRKSRIQEQRAFSNKMHLSIENIDTPFGRQAIEKAKLGLHPDFLHLKGTDDIEYHYIVSVFIDIQGSTNLHKKYNLEDIYSITNTIQSAAIHTCLVMGGHIQRLQGDGVFAYFGGKSMDRNTAVRLATTACSMFTYYVQTDLKDMFLVDGIEDISTRIGIDFGENDDVLWANFGLMDVCELTTNSLHTSLASKMQAWANRNGIVVGQNVKNLLHVNEDVFDLVRNSKGEVEKRYIFEAPERSFRYTQYKFEWFKFLKSLPFIRSGNDGRLYIVDPAAKERERIDGLKSVASMISSGNAYLTKTGEITDQPLGVQHQTHRFHYGE